MHQSPLLVSTFQFSLVNALHNYDGIEPCIPFNCGMWTVITFQNGQYMNKWNNIKTEITTNLVKVGKTWGDRQRQEHCLGKKSKQWIFILITEPQFRLGGQVNQ